MRDWTCGRCGEAQFTLGEAEPPADCTCHGCRRRAAALRPVSELLLAAGVPKTFLRGVSRAEWQSYFGRLEFPEWPPASRWLFLWGPTGTGKTSAATIHLREHIERGGRGLWASGMAWREELAAEMQPGMDRVALARLTRPELLVLDEPFAGNVTAYVADRVLLLARERDERGGRTIVTSQLGPKDLMHFAAESRFATGSVAAAASRMMSGVVEHLGGVDVRLVRGEMR